MQLSPGEIGALSELKVCIWLIESGFEVYRNVTPNGKFDIVAIKDNEIYRIDVTTASDKKYYARGKQEKAKENLGHVVYVFHDGSIKWDYEHDFSYEKTQHQCSICNIGFFAYEKERKTCGKLECHRAYILKMRHEKIKKLNPSLK